jgi:hypothetical protein
MSSLSALTESLQQALLAEGVAPLSPKARASGKQRTQGIPAGGKGVASGAPRRKPRQEAAPSLTAILDQGAASLRQGR